MPEFILDTGTTGTHRTYDALPSFIQGALQCAFFTGIQFYDPRDESGEPVELDSLGLANLDPSALDSIVADCVRFMRANSETLDRVTDSGEYDMEQAGMDFWFTRHGHGVGFWDRGLGDDGETLSDAARYFGECDLFPVPLSDETGEPLPGYHVAHDQPQPGNPDPDDSDLWRVYVSHDADPLTPDESAYLASLIPPGDDLATVGGRYGAPMGRASYEPDPDLADSSVTMRRVTLDPGGYDAGGAYWGIGLPLFRAVDAQGVTVKHIRAKNAKDAESIYLAAQNAISGQGVPA